MRRCDLAGTARRCEPCRAQVPQGAMIIHGNPAHERFPQIKVQRLRDNPAHVRVSKLWGANILD